MAVRNRLTHEFRNTLLTGLAVLAPLGLTVYVLQGLVGAADQLIAMLPERLTAAIKPDIPGSGLLMALVIVLAVGLLTRNLIGRQVMAAFTRLIERIPLVASLYKLFRQIAETFLTGGPDKGFKRVVLVQWPRPGVWTLAFVTANAGGEVLRRLNGGGSAETWLNLFIPTTPNPTSGFYLIVRESECQTTSLSVEAAFKVIISAGALPA